MRLSDFYTQFRRQSTVAKSQSQEQPGRTRQKQTLEAMTRPAQTKSLKVALRQR